MCAGVPKIPVYDDIIQFRSVLHRNAKETAMNEMPPAVIPPSEMNEIAGGPASGATIIAEDSGAKVAPRNYPSVRIVRIHLAKHGWALTTVGVVAFVLALSLGQKFLIPVIFSILIAYTLNPLVCLLQRLKLPRVVATSVLMGGIVLGLAMHVNSLIFEFNSILGQLPEMAHMISAEMTKGRPGQATLMQKVQDVATELETATSQAAGTKSQLHKPVPFEPVFKLRDWLVEGSMNLLGFLEQLTMILFLVFFILLSGNMFKRKLVKLAGPALSSRKVAVQILNHINTSIQRYMWMLLVTNCLVGALSWIAFKIIGLDNAGAWSITAGFLHIIPYFGPVLIVVSTGLAAFLQFDSISTALLVAGISLGIATFVGIFVNTWMTGRIAKMNPVAVFIALLFWGWLWGTWGLLLGVPIIVLIKVVSEHIEGMETIAELLGD